MRYKKKGMLINIQPFPDLNLMTLEFKTRPNLSPLIANSIQDDFIPRHYKDIRHSHGGTAELPVVYLPAHSPARHPLANRQKRRPVLTLLHFRTVTVHHGNV